MRHRQIHPPGSSCSRALSCESACDSPSILPCGHQKLVRLRVPNWLSAPEPPSALPLARASFTRKNMWRLCALIWLALSLAVASGPAFAVPSPECPMASSSHMAGGHDEMGCCTEHCAADCATVCAGTLMLPVIGASTVAVPITEQLAARRATRLLSANLKGADPPPRTTFS